jgi:GntR family transcriptional regulator/MocR family aminotransferase
MLPAASTPTGRSTFICRGCYFVYSEIDGLPQTGVAPGTKFSDLPAGWECPDCGTDRTKFRPTA